MLFKRSKTTAKAKFDYDKFSVKLSPEITYEFDTILAIFISAGLRQLADTTNSYPGEYVPEAQNEEETGFLEWKNKLREVASLFDELKNSDYKSTKTARSKVNKAFRELAKIYPNLWD